MTEKEAIKLAQETADISRNTMYVYFRVYDCGVVYSSNRLSCNYNLLHTIHPASTASDDLRAARCGCQCSNCLSIGKAA